MRARLEQIKKDALKVRQRALKAEKEEKPRESALKQEWMKKAKQQDEEEEKKKSSLALVPKRAASESLELPEDETAEELRAAAKKKRRKENLEAPKATKTEKKAWIADAAIQEALADENGAQRNNGVFADRHGCSLEISCHFLQFL